ncbi:hypothetical protein CEXT_240871 [Caerostris extrusa]|uniref:Uncharacterized protein n=1 Tax=Caerostris extrusa TaxID=172846 RepID=A0AAV4XG09_CAEEX|nr:hypothetical protein CEXT_240871 [Caerostris extrusa]
MKSRADFLGVISYGVVRTVRCVTCFQRAWNKCLELRRPNSLPCDFYHRRGRVRNIHLGPREWPSKGRAVKDAKNSSGRVEMVPAMHHPSNLCCQFQDPSKTPSETRKNSVTIKTEIAPLFRIASSNKKIDCVSLDIFILWSSPQSCRRSVFHCLQPSFFLDTAAHKKKPPSFSFIDTFHRFSGHYSFSGQASNQKVTHLCQKEIQTLLYRQLRWLPKNPAFTNPTENGNRC